MYRDQGWITIGDWLGKGERDSKNKQWRPFLKARDYVRALGIRNTGEWNALCRSGNLPVDIPTDPRRIYAAVGWQSMGDWLGTNSVASTKKQFLTFEEARELVRARGFQTKTEYDAWARSDMRPPNIPALPSRTYARTGWRGWGDWLGAYSKWSKTAVLAFVSSLVPMLNRLQPIEIYAILRQNGCLSAVDSLPDSSPLRQLVHAALHQDTQGAERSIRELGLEQLDDEEIEVCAGEDPENDAVAETALPLLEKDGGLPELTPVGILSGLDDLERSVVLSDTETIEFLITNAVGRLWSRILRSEDVEQDLAGLRSHNPGSYGSRVRERFLAQFNGAKRLIIPEGYSFRKKGELLPPNLMQRLVVHRVAVDGRVGNWSGTGAGKTLARSSHRALFERNLLS